MVEHPSHLPTVFIVDDDDSVRRALSRLFASIGLRTEAFSSAVDFLTRREENARGCIVLDVQMPDITGVDLQHHLTELGINLPVIFVTAHADVPLAVRAIKNGAMEVFTKPFNEQALLDAVQKGLEQDHERFQISLETEELRRRYATLTPRERMVMQMVVTGSLNKQVAAAIGTSLKTVKVHRAHVMEKMAADSLAELVRMALRLEISRD